MVKHNQSIWVDDFRAYEQFEMFLSKKLFSVFDWIDDHLICSRHSISFPAYCSVCEGVTQMHVDWYFGEVEEKGSIHPAWTETFKCEQCGLNSRMRALWEFVKDRVGFQEIRKAYIAEQITPFYKLLKRYIPSLVGSEYINPNYKSGTKVRWKGLQFVRHEDLTSLSFESESFDLVVTLDVFEHIPNYIQAFQEINRVLLPSGHLVFTIPFFYNLKATRIRASLSKEGIIHHYPLEIHGNPISSDGSLCFQNFGWDILAQLRTCGFSDSMASLYWGPWQGHLGYPFFIFWARK